MVGSSRTVAGGALAAAAALLLLANPAQAAKAGRAAVTEQSRRALEDYARLLFIEHRPKEAWGRHFAPDLMQHDAEIGDGGHADTDFLDKRRAAHPEKYLPVEQYASVVDNLLADGDLVVAKSRLFTGPQDHGRTFVDMWRIEDGKFVEHWDVIQPVPSAPLNDATTGCGHVASYAEARLVGDTVARPTCGGPGPASHRAASLAVVNAYLAMTRRPGGDAEAVKRFIADDFVQHSPHIPQGKAALAAYFTSNAAARARAGRHSVTARVVADGDFVMLHRWVTTRDDPRGQAYIDLFRVRGGQIAEHWDIIQPVPPFSVSGRSMVIGPLEPGRTVGPEAAGH